MSDETLYPIYEEFLTKFQDRLEKETTLMHLTTELIGSKVGYPVKKIITHIEKVQVHKDYIPYMENKLCVMSIIGSAFPMVSGWRLSNAIGKTIFTAEGFNLADGGFSQSFIFDYIEGKAQIEFISLDYILPPEDYYRLEIEYSEEGAELMERYVTEGLAKQQGRMS